MNNQNSDINQILKNSENKIDAKDIEHARNSGDASALVKNLSDSDKEKLSALLSDKDKLEKVLKSPQAQMLLKIFGGGKNG